MVEDAITSLRQFASSSPLCNQAAFVSIVEAMLESQEVRAVIDDKGVLWPSRTSLYAVMALQSEINPRMVEIVRELTGSAMITLPSSLRDLESSETAADVDRFMR